MEVKDILKQRRLEKGLSLDDVARSVGVTGATISRWESGEIANMRRDKIVKLAEALDLSPSVIMGWEEPSEQEGYYTNPETAKLAQELHDNPDLRALLDASRDMKPEQMRNVTAVIQAMKDTNPDG
ncbi:MAG: helix-turn-helix transcriptional regulator [Eubacteriales bacterium]|nr:helix-turn-helix transcriptional regulator [Eubacteriales bacterium]